VLYIVPLSYILIGLPAKAIASIQNGKNGNLAWIVSGFVILLYNCVKPVNRDYLVDELEAGLNRLIFKIEFNGKSIILVSK
jgi:hypothetical protein